jgi:hypothetical protein
MTGMGAPRIEDLYEDPPIEIELTGGHFDGHRMFVPDNRDTLLMPLPVDIVAFGPEPDVTRASMNVEVYRFTGSVRDDGTRVFRFAFRES